MLHFSRNYLFLFLLVWLYAIQTANAQGLAMPGGSSPAADLFGQNADSSRVDSMSSKWKDEQAKIDFRTLYSEQKRFPDTAISEIHHFQPWQPWWGKTLGNSGTATRNLFFTPDATPGLHLGYPIYDLYKFYPDSLRFYNTTRPYSVFSFMLGSKNQQNVEILHTQNITPRWNFAGRLRYLSSEGFYALQKANSIAGSLNTDYSSKNERYRVKAALIYNRFKQDENGGIADADSFLALSNFSDRSRIPVNFANLYNTNNKSPVQNTLRDFDFFLENNYSWGTSDTLYNEDSTKATPRFTPRFRLQHELNIHSEKHQYKDLLPDSLRYAPFTLLDTLTGRDSVYGAQNWTYYDNKFSLNGFLGKEKQLAQIQVGIANRIDYFEESYVRDRDQQTNFGNYVFGLIQKEALAPKQWSYQAGAWFYFTGNAVGNFDLNLSAGKDLGKWGQFSAGARQTLSNAPYAWQHFKTNYYSREFNLNKTSITQIWGKVNIPKIKLELTINNYLINNYLYFDNHLTPLSAKTFSLLQVYAQKKISYGIFFLNNELAWQQATAHAPVNLPAFLIREQLALEGMLFKNALHVALGLEMRYETNYYADGYSPFLNQFYYQSDYKTKNIPQLSAFFNFKVRNFRAYLIGGQLQQLVAKTNINAPGYPGENTLFRFGFIWILIN